MIEDDMFIDDDDDLPIHDPQFEQICAESDRLDNEFKQLKKKLIEEQAPKWLKRYGVIKFDELLKELKKLRGPKTKDDEVAHAIKFFIGCTVGQQTRMGLPTKLSQNAAVRWATATLKNRGENPPNPETIKKRFQTIRLRMLESGELPWEDYGPNGTD